MSITNNEITQNSKSEPKKFSILCNFKVTIKEIYEPRQQLLVKCSYKKIIKCTNDMFKYDATVSGYFYLKGLTLFSDL